ncbi:MFS transporter [Amnibacterium kyonggiense]|uniref:Putative MFS family arabinose efflux permease n=1 Tax=Amnibacterium kyonggiense TaxID=595671 RepID=A0A4R7FST4_9MICO|nr:MFS transporter [Amnibacterium kyonggiense]TDS80739.1 putative MFS family arabinose efflux permease [Amnibacterium kyonggiense]
MVRPEDERIGFGAALGLGALVLATFVAVTTEIVPVGLLPQLSRAFSVPEAVTGLLVTVYAALVAVLAVPLTRLTTRLPRKPLLLATIALYSVGNLVIAVAPTFAVLCVGRAVGGVAHALFFSLSSAYASSLVPRRVQGRALAIAASGASIGYVLGVPLVTSIGAALDWRAAFAALAIGGVLAGLVTAGALPPAGAEDAAAAATRAPRSRLGGAAVVNAVAFFGHYALYTYVSAVLLRAAVPEGAIGAALFLFGATGVVGLWLAGLVIDRRPRAGFVGALVLAAVCVVALLALGGSTAGTVAAVSAWVVGFGAIPVFCTAACLRARSASPDVSAAVNNAASNVGIGLGAAAGGLVFAVAGVPAVVVLAAAAFAIAAVLVLVLRRSFPARLQDAG